jgi:hypothetical protein
MEHDLDTLYEQAMDYLNEDYPYWLTHVLNMGAPDWTHEVPTAAVAIDKDERDASRFRYLFNPEFAASLTARELAFVMSHETMHIALDHLEEGRSGDYPDHMKHNIATDCIINDWLDSVGMDIAEGACRGEDIVGFNCAGLTTEQVYHMIPDSEENKELAESGNATTGDHDWMETVAEALAEAMAEDEELAEAMGRLDDEQPADFETDSTPCSLSTHDDGMDEREWAREKGVGLKWAELLEKINPDIFRGKGLGRPPMASWHKPARRLMGCYPQTILPVYEKRDTHLRRRTDEKPHVVMFIDASGSVSAEQVKRFVNLALSVPLDKVELTLVAAATRSQEVADLKALEVRGRGALPSVGGGNGPISGFYSGHGVCEYMAMQHWLRKSLASGRLKEYPKAVIAISDGHSGLIRNQITDDEASRWTFLIDTYGDAHRPSWHQYDTHRIFTKEQFHTLKSFTKVAA